MKNLPKEWLLGAGCAALAVLLLLTASGPEKASFTGVARGTYDPGSIPEPRWLPVDVAALWSPGPDPFKPSSDREDLPAEDLGIPDFPANPLGPFPVRPSPEPRFATLKPYGVDAAALPLQEEIDRLRALGKEATEAPTPPAPIWDEIVTKNGPVLGTILKEEPNGNILLRTQAGNMNRTFKKEEIISVKRGRTPAQEYEEEAAKLPPGNAKEHERLAEWCLEKDLLEEAARELEKSIAIQPRLETIGKLGDIYQQLSSPDREIRLYRKSVERPPARVEVVWTRLGKVYEALDLPTRAIDAYLGALGASLRHAEARQRLVALFSMDGRFNEAEEQLSRLSEDLTAKETPETHLAAGTMAYFQGQMDRAKAELTIAGPGGLHLKACAELYLGMSREAALSLIAAIEKNPDNIDAWINLGAIYGQAGEWTRARACFEEAAWRAPVSPHPQAALGWLSLREKKTAEAKASYEEAVKRDARCAQALFGLGKLSLEAGEAKAAEGYLLSALKAGAGTVAFRELGLARLRLKDTSGAIEALRRAVEFSSDADAHALYGFAVLLTNPQIADQQFRQAFEADREHLLALCGLAAVDYARGDLAGAGRRFETILSRAPDHPFAIRGARLAREAATRTLWKDDFERKDGDSLLRQWVEREKEGLRVTLARGRAVMSGKQLKDDGITALLQPTSEKFLSIEAEFDFSKVARATSGLVVAITPTSQNPTGQAVRFVRTSKGRMGAWTGPANATATYNDLGEAPTGTVRLKIARIVDSKGVLGDWQLFVNGTLVGNIKADLRAPRLEAGAFGSALRDETWEVAVDNVRVIEAK